MTRASEALQKRFRLRGAQLALKEATGIHQSTLSLLASGKRDATEEQKRALAKHAGVPKAWWVS